MAKDWTQIFNKYRGFWVALEDDEETVVASGKTAQEAADVAKQRGVTKPILARIPEELVTYVGFGVRG